MTAHAFLLAAEARYSSLQHYADQGQVRTLRPGHASECDFATAYRQGGAFSFRFWSGHPYPPLRHLVSRWEIGADEAGQPYFISHFAGHEPQRELQESLALAIAGATGISRSSAHTIGTLLFQDIGGMPLKDWKRLRFRSMRMVDGVLCVTISGRHPTAGRMLASFGAHDLLLRRLQRKLRSGTRLEERRRVDAAEFTSTSSAPRGIAA